MFIVKEADLSKVLASTRTDTRIAINTNEIPGFYIPHRESWQDKANEETKKLEMLA